MNSTAKHARKLLAWLCIIIIALVGVQTYYVLAEGASWTPKLALDLEGGSQIILTPEVTSGETKLNREQMNQAVKIIRSRVDATGVAEAEIAIQGTDSIVITMPGKVSDEMKQKLSTSSQLQFRSVIQTTAGVTSQITDPNNPQSTPTPAPQATGPAPSVTVDKNTPPQNPAWVTPELQSYYNSFACNAQTQVPSTPDPDQPLVTCDFAAQKYILSIEEISGDAIDDAVAMPETTSSGAITGKWVIQIDLDAEGTKKFTDISERLYSSPAPQNQFAFVLDGFVISAPVMQAVIADGKPSISGNFTQESAESLAQQLKYGALPIGFNIQSVDTVSPTLGTSQLASGILAGIIGLILVFIYSLLQYRLLGFVTVLSLAVAAVITYLVITIFSASEGYRLSLAGVAGLIVAIGITADSFIVYFERIRDELRDGMSLDGSVSVGWRKAWRTILASDGVNLIAAVILFILAVGNVRGFALTLGITTIVDVLVVALFTHPMLILLSKTKFYANGHKLSGLDPNQLGAVYKGRAKFVTPNVTTGKAAKSNKEAMRRQTIAERKANERSENGKEEQK